MHLNAKMQGIKRDICIASFFFPATYTKLKFATFSTCLHDISSQITLEMKI